MNNELGEAMRWERLDLFFYRISELSVCSKLCLFVYLNLNSLHICLSGFALKGHRLPSTLEFFY